MKISEYAEKHEDIMFTAEEWLDIQEIKKLVQRLIDLEKEVENLKNEKCRKD